MTDDGQGRDAAEQLEFPPDGGRRNENGRGPRPPREPRADTWTSPGEPEAGDDGPVPAAAHGPQGPPVAHEEPAGAMAGWGGYPAETLAGGWDAGDWGYPPDAAPATGPLRASNGRSRQSPRPGWADDAPQYAAAQDGRWAGAPPGHWENPARGGWGQEPEWAPRPGRLNERQRGGARGDGRRPRPGGPGRRGRPPLAAAAWTALAVAVAGGVVVAAFARSSPGRAPGVGSPAAASSPAAAVTSAPPATSAPGALPGYPGRRGSVSVQSIASAGGVQVAVGIADGIPAVWRRAGAGWALAPSAAAASPASGSSDLASVAHGRDGWIAAGVTNAGGESAPLVLASADGLNWHAVGGGAFAGVNAAVSGVAAGPLGYAAVGSAWSGGVAYAALWWSPDLLHWTQEAGDGGGSEQHSQALAVTVTPSGGFAAVGRHDGCHAAWVTADGQHWQPYDLPKPEGTSSPVLRQAATSAGVIVAAGDIGRGSGRYPLLAASVDGGAQWQQTVIGGPGGPQGTVTALAADGTGFIAAGLEGPAGHQEAVMWTSPNGIQWSAAQPAPDGTQAITALAPDGRQELETAVSDGSGGAESSRVTAVG